MTTTNTIGFSSCPDGIQGKHACIYFSAVASKGSVCSLALIKNLKIQMAPLPETLVTGAVGSFVFILMPLFLRQRLQLPSRNFKQLPVRVCVEAAKNLSQC